jgi:hypothetical protein
MKTIILFYTAITVTGFCTSKEDATSVPKKRDECTNVSAERVIGRPLIDPAPTECVLERRLTQEELQTLLVDIKQYCEIIADEQCWKADCWNQDAALYVVELIGVMRSGAVG